MRVIKSLWCWWSAAILLCAIKMSQSNSTKKTKSSEILNEEIEPRFLDFNYHRTTTFVNFGVDIPCLINKLLPKVLIGTNNMITAVQNDVRKLFILFDFIDSKLDKIQKGVSETKQNLEALSKGIHHMTDLVSGTNQKIEALSRGIPHLIKWENALDTLDQYLKPINNLYIKFGFYKKFQSSVDNQTLLEFAKSVTSHSTNSIQALMANINSMIAPNNAPPPSLNMKKGRPHSQLQIENRMKEELALIEKRMNEELASIQNRTKVRRQASIPTLRSGVFALLENALENYNDCHYAESPQHLIYGMYSLLYLSLSRGFLMVYFSYQILNLHNAGNFKLEIDTAIELYKHYNLNLYINGIPSVNKASNGFKRCDPLNHVEGETFIMVKELMQGYIINENDLFFEFKHNLMELFHTIVTKLYRVSCHNNCEYYNRPLRVRCRTYENSYCTRRKKCDGLLYDCKTYEERAEVCISDIPYRRYDWIKNTEKTLGKQGDCDNKMKLKTFFTYTALCSYCVCLCEDPHSKTTLRILSLRTSLSNIAEGKVVTGVRFIELNRVFYIQVQEGSALPEGQIDSSTLEWVRVHQVHTGKNRELKDFVTLTYKERIMDLDKLEAPNGFVMTGVRFFITKKTHFSFAIYVTKINYTTGNLSVDRSYWINADNSKKKTKSPRTEIKLNEPDDPRYSKSSSDLFSESNTFIKFQPTSMEKDVSQLTVPFFDAQPVAPTPPKWIEGLQMYHRGSEGYGGFIGLKVFSYNITRYINQK